MSYKVIWVRRALVDYDTQINYITHESPQSALLVAERIEGTVKLLQEFPTGKTGRVSETYEKKVLKTSLIVVYKRISESELVILRIIHTSRNWVRGMYPD